MASNYTATSEEYRKAKACVARATRHFVDVPTISAKEILQLQQDATAIGRLRAPCAVASGKDVILVDVRTKAEQTVSMLRGAVSREEFEKSPVGEAAGAGVKFKTISAERTGGRDADNIVVIPYCTVGYRSGKYGKKLLDLGYPSVRNSEGVVMWTHDVGSGLVNKGGQGRAGKRGRGSAGRAAAAAAAGNGGDLAEVKRVHVYGPPWNFARKDFEAVEFSSMTWLSKASSFFSKVLRR